MDFYLVFHVVVCPDLCRDYGLLISQRNGKKEEIIGQEIWISLVLKPEEKQVQKSIDKLR